MGYSTTNIACMWFCLQFYDNPNCGQKNDTQKAALTENRKPRTLGWVFPMFSWTHHVWIRLGYWYDISSKCVDLRDAFYSSANLISNLIVFPGLSDFPIGKNPLDSPTMSMEAILAALCTNCTSTGMCMIRICSPRPAASLRMRTSANIQAHSAVSNDPEGK